MKKLISICLIVIVSASLLTGCDDMVKRENGAKENNRFVVLDDMYAVGNGNYATVIYDGKTKLVYLRSGNGGGLCPFNTVNRMGFASQMTLDEYQSTK